MVVIHSSSEMISHPRQLYRGWWLGLLCLLSFVQAQVIDITVPEARTVNPGDFVTLVFRLQTDQDTTVGLRVKTRLGWRILREPDETVLRAGESVPVPLTLEVPEDASALVSEEVTLEVLADSPEQNVSVSVTIDVSEKLDLLLEAPAEVLLSDEALEVLTRNEGNVTDTIKLELFYAEELITTRDFELEPQGINIQTFELTQDGVYSLVLSSERGVSLRKGITVISFGVPTPDPFMLEASIRSSYTLGGEWYVATELEGQLSDYAGIRTKVDSRFLDASFIEFKGDLWFLRLGETGGDPFGLGLSAALGFVGREDQAPWSTAYGFGWLSQDKYAGFMATSYRKSTFGVALGAGMQAGQWQGGLNISQDIPDIEGSVKGSVIYRRQALSLVASATAKGFSEDFPGRVQTEVKARNLLGDDADFGIRLNYGVENWNITSFGIWPLAEKGESDWEMNVAHTVVSEQGNPGELSVSVGQDQSSFYFRAYDIVEPEVIHNYGYGVLYNAKGLGISLELGRKEQGVGYNLGLTNSFTFYPALNDFDGKLEARYQFSRNPFTASASTYWDWSGDAVGANLSGNMSIEDQTFQASVGMNYAYFEADPWSFNFSIGTDLGFNFEVPQGVSDIAGGRKLGLLSGSIKAGDIPLGNVEIEVDRYRLLTDEEGYFSAYLEPGRYTVKVNLSTIPITFRLESLAEYEVDISAKGQTQLDFVALQTAAITGKVLQDTDGDGVADEPQQGIKARLQLVEDNGTSRFITTGDDGSFAIRGLLAGAATLKIVSQPLGSKIIGKDSEVLVLESGNINELLFLVKPPVVVTQTFGETDLRIRRIEVELDRVRSGTDPAITVSLQGDADAVVVATSTTRSELQKIEDGWSGSIDIPLDAPNGPVELTVTATQGQGQATRGSTVFVDPQAAALELTIPNTVKADEVLMIQVKTYFTAKSISVTHPFGDAITLSEKEPRMWEGQLLIPKDTKAGVYTLSVLAVTRQDNRFEEELGFRVVEE